MSHVYAITLATTAKTTAAATREAPAETATAAEAVMASTIPGLDYVSLQSA